MNIMMNESSCWINRPISEIGLSCIQMQTFECTTIRIGNNLLVFWGISNQMGTSAPTHDRCGVVEGGAWRVPLSSLRPLLRRRLKRLLYVCISGRVDPRHPPDGSRPKRRRSDAICVRALDCEETRGRLSMRPKARLARRSFQRMQILGDHNNLHVVQNKHKIKTNRFYARFVQRFKHTAASDSSFFLPSFLTKTSHHFNIASRLIILQTGPLPRQSMCIQTMNQTSCPCCSAMARWIASSTCLAACSPLVRPSFSAASRALAASAARARFPTA